MFNQLKWPLRIALLLFGLLAFIAAGLATTAGQRLLLSAVGYITSTQDFKLSFGRLKGSLFNRASIESITVFDRQGLSFELQNFQLDWTVLSLLHGQVDIQRLSIETLKITRQPVSPEQPQQSSKSYLSILLLRLKLKEMQINELALDKSLAGVAARFKIEANADLADYRHGLSARLLAERLDRPDDVFKAQLAFNAANQNFKVQVSASEASGGFVAALLGMPQRPALALEFSGKGPLDTWRADWSVSKAGQPVVLGGVRLDREGERHRLALEFSGHMQTFFPRSSSALMAGKARGAVHGHFTGLKSFDARHINLMTDALALHAAGGFEVAKHYVYGSLSLRAGRDDNSPLTFVLPNNDQLSVRKLQVSANLPDQRLARNVSLEIVAQDVTHAQAEVAAFQLKANAKQLDAAGTSPLFAEHFEVQATTKGFSSPIGGLVDAVGTKPQLNISGSFEASTLTVDRFHVDGSETQIIGRGVISANRQTGTASLAVDDISCFTELFGEHIAGRLNLKTAISAEAGKGRYDFSFEGKADELNLGQGVWSKLAGDSVELSGNIARDDAGKITLQKLDAAGDVLSFSTQGVYAHNDIEFDHTLKIIDLSALHADLSGAGRLDMRLRGAPDNLSSRIRGVPEKAAWRGTAIEGITLRFDGQGPLEAHSGQIELAGTVERQRLAGRARLTLGSSGLIALQKTKIEIGRNSLTGNIKFERKAKMSAKFALKAPHLADLNAIAGRNISGAMTGELTLSRDSREAAFILNADAPFISFAGITSKNVNAVAALRTFDNAIGGHASLKVDAFSNENLTARSLSLELREDGKRMAFDGKGLINDASLSLGGSFKPSGKSIEVSINNAGLDSKPFKLNLAHRAQVTIAENGLTFNSFRLSTNGGFAELGGHIRADNLDLRMRIQKLPAQIANIFLPKLELDGTISGSAHVIGPLVDTATKIKATWKQATARRLRDLYIPPVTIALNGNVYNDKANVRIEMRGPHSLALSVKGNAQLKPDHPIQLQVSGNVPLALSNTALASRATRFGGYANVSGSVSGTLNQPRLNVKIQIPDASVYDPQSGIKIKRMVALLGLTENGLQIDSLTGESELGGALFVSGTISSADEGAPQADITIELKQFRFDDRQLMAGEMDSTIALTGPLNTLTASGSIFLRRLDVMVPSTLPSSIAELNVQHVNAPKFLAKHTKSDKLSASGSDQMRINLDLHLDAANRIFVRGRGLDVQMGGNLKVRGRSTAPLTEGTFTMQRGTLNILGRRLDFHRGNIFFHGALEPVLDMAAVTVVDGVSIVVTISGAASRPIFRFTSTPELPGDEIIARLLFNKALVGLSPLQLVQMASEVDKIGGLSSGPSLLDELKSSAGIDVLDMTTDQTGAATLSAGRYVTDKTFIGVKQGATANSSRVIVDHDFTKNLKARGEVGADGNSKLGIGLEWDY